MLDQLASAPETAEEVVRVMRILADPTRLRLLSMLRKGEMNVSALCDRLALAQPTVSHHLGLLRSVGLVENRRQGKQIHYSLSPKTISLLERDRGMMIRTGPVHLQLLEPKPVAPLPAVTTNASGLLARPMRPVSRESF